MSCVSKVYQIYFQKFLTEHIFFANFFEIFLTLKKNKLLFFRYFRKEKEQTNIMFLYWPFSRFLRTRKNSKLLFLPTTNVF